VFQALWARCMEAGLPIGVAPNIHVSLVLLPDEARWLVQDPATIRRLRGREWKRRALQTAFAATWYGKRLIGR